MKNIDFYLDKIIRYLTPLIFLLPFLTMSNFYFPYITPRNFIFRIIVSVLLALYLFLFFRNRKKYKPVVGSIVIAYLALGLIMTLSSLLAGDFLYSFWSDYERMEGLLGYYYLVAYLFVILGVYYRKKSWHQLLYFSVFVSYILSFIALTQILNVKFLIDSSGGDRVSSTLGNPTYLAAYALFHIFFALYLLFKDKRQALKLELLGFYLLDLLMIFFEIKARKIGHPGMLSVVFQNWSLMLSFIGLQIIVHINFYLRKTGLLLATYSKYLYFLVVIFLNFLALFNTQTRGALMGLFLGIIVASLFILFAGRAGRVDKKFKLTAAALIVLVIVFLGTAFVFKNSNFIKNNKSLRRISDISLSDTTAQTRLLTWQLSFKGWQEKPILGWGEEKFYVVFNKYFPSAIFKNAGSTVWFDRPHNIFIQYLVNGGALGFLAYLGIYIFILIRLFKYYRRTKDAPSVGILLAILIGYGVQNFFVFDSLNTSVLFVLYLAVVTFITTPAQKVKADNAKPIKAVWLSYTIPLLVLIIGYSINVPQMTANTDFVSRYKQIATATTYNEQDQLDFIKVINKHYFGRFERRQVYSEYATSIAKKGSFSKDDKLAIVDLADTEMQKSIAEQPDNVRNYAFLVNLYLEAAEKLNKSYADKNIALINKAIPLSPARTPFYYSLGRARMIRGETTEAVAVFEKAKEISPDVFESYVNVMAAYLTAGDLDKTKAAVEELKNKKSFKLKDNSSQYLRADYYSRVAEVYFFFKHSSEATAILEEAVGLYPNNKQLLTQIIFYYSQGANKQKIDFYMNKLTDIDPAMAEQVRQELEQNSIKTNTK